MFTASFFFAGAACLLSFLIGNKIGSKYGGKIIFGDSIKVPVNADTREIGEAIAKQIGSMREHITRTEPTEVSESFEMNEELQAMYESLIAIDADVESKKVILEHERETLSERFKQFWTEVETTYNKQDKLLKIRDDKKTIDVLVETEL